MRVTQLLSALLLVFLGMQAHAQKEIRYCGQSEQTEALFNKFPHLRHEAELAEAQLDAEEAARRAGGDRDDVLYIPVVFHIIHDNGDENISDEQVYSAMEVLNTDFRMMNSDLGIVIPEFQGITSDIEIEFRLAKRDPNGNCTKGINRIQSELTYEGEEDMKSLIQWPRNRYMNVWVCAYAAGAAGYTFLPASVNSGSWASQDGIVLLHSYTGAIGTSSVQRSRTLTHEVGHWLNLRHTWGSGNTPGVAANCDQDDGVEDTPNTVGWQSCNLDGETCGSLDNVQNYMEYSYCSRMFTQGQRSRMRTAAQSSTAQRNQLITPSTHVATGIFEEGLLCNAEFYVNQSVICVGEEVQFFDDSFHGIVEWTWNLGDGQVISGNDPEVHRNPLVTYDEPGIYTVTLTVGNGNESITEVKEAFVHVLPSGALPNPFAEGWENGVNEENWFITNQHDNVTWELTGAAAYTGTRSVRIRNVINDFESSTDELISSTLDLSNAVLATITYKWSYANKVNETDDRLRVSVSRDCGETWALRKLHRGFTDLPTVAPQNLAFTPTSTSQWAQNTVSITDSSYMVENFRFKFEFEGRGGNNLYLDDINIQYFSEIDLGVNESAAVQSVALYPNPLAEGSTALLEFNLAEALPVQVDLIDVLGRPVRQLVSEMYASGEHRVALQGDQLSAGVYLVRVQLGDAVTTERLIVR
jgi:PKD repeat protein